MLYQYKILKVATQIQLREFVKFKAYNSLWQLSWTPAGPSAVTRVTIGQMLLLELSTNTNYCTTQSELANMYFDPKVACGLVPFETRR